MIADILEHDFPTSWACALMYGDFEGLEMEERVQILHFQLTNGLCCCQSVSEEESRPGHSTYIWLIDENYNKPKPTKP